MAPLLAEAVIDWKGETGRAFDVMCTCHTVCLLSRGLRVCQQLCVGVDVAAVCSSSCVVGA